MAKENKSNIAEMEKRVSLVLDMLLSGLRRREILEYVRKKDGLNWDVVDSQVDNYIAKANREIVELGSEDKKKSKCKAKARFNFLYRKLINVKDYKGAITVVEKEAILDGLMITKQANVNSDGTDVKQVVIIQPVASLSMLPNEPE